MKRREFLRSIAIAAVALTTCPTDFLTPHSQPKEVYQWDTGWIEWKKYEKISSNEYVFTGVLHANMTKSTRMAMGVIKDA